MKKRLSIFITSLVAFFIAAGLMALFCHRMFMVGERILSSGTITRLAGPSDREKAENEKDSEAVVVILRNEGKIKGIISDQGQDGLTLYIGFGSVTIENKDILTIVKCSDLADLGMSEDEIGWYQYIAYKDDTQVERLRKETEEQYYKRMAEAARLMRESAKHEYGVTSIKYSDRSRIIVKTLINDEVTTNLILDTGATWVMITPKIAKALGIDLKGKKYIPFTVADGRYANGIPVVLDSVKVGNCEARKVKAAVIVETTRKGQKVDGLLGMTFLRNFHMKLDTGNKILTLSERNQ